MAGQMRLLNWGALRQGKLYGFCDVELPIGLRINQCPVLDGPEGLWASLPTRVEIDREGRARTGANGERIYQPMNEWRSRRLREAFSERVVALVRQA
jgi:hypothetical protein